ncbi:MULTISPECIES: FliO/MopB family protein [Luteimonas]|uniref:FliO/MopB family protein n=1 Tax=Luteimonas TaxID=83614 RepID=UPI0013041826|nr:MULTISPECIES: flagellar biosynthetic protein FliO [Luteimonas]
MHAVVLLPYARTAGVPDEPTNMIRSARAARRIIPFACTAGLLAVAGTAFAASSTPATDVVPGNDSFIGEMIAIVLPMAFIIIALLFFLRILRRRYGLAGRDSPLSVLQILPVGPRERVVLLQSRAGRVFAIGVAGQTVTFITDLEPEDVVSPPDASPNAASDTLPNIVADR